MNQIEEPGINGVVVSSVFKMDPIPTGWELCDDNCKQKLVTNDQIILRTYTPRVLTTSRLQDFKTAGLLINIFTTVSSINGNKAKLDYGLNKIQDIDLNEWEIIRYKK